MRFVELLRAYVEFSKMKIYMCFLRGLLHFMETYIIFAENNYVTPAKLTTDDNNCNQARRPGRWI